MPDLDDIELSETYADLVFLALDHGVDSVRESGGPLIPFVVFEQNGERISKAAIRYRRLIACANSETAQ